MHQEVDSHDCQSLEYGDKKNGWDGQKIKTSSYKINKFWGCMYSMGAIKTMSYIWKLLTEYILKVLLRKILTTWGDVC